MAETINVNDLSLTHKGSAGFSAATLPDVCKTPTGGGPVPIPYPNISFTQDLVNGTKTVFADGGNMIAIKGSEYYKSIGDEPGTLGGVKSGTFMKESKWILYSFDVKMDGKNACRLTDPKTQNHANTVDMAGEMHAPVPPGLPEVEVICAVICKCDAAPPAGAAGQDLKQQCVSKVLKELDDAAGNKTTIKPEINYNMTTSPPSPIMSRSNPLQGTEYLPGRTGEIPGFRPGAGMVRRPDAVLVSNPNLPPTQDNLRAVVEIKFPPDARDAAQIAAYQEIAGTNPVVELSPEKCGCPKPGEEKKIPWGEVALLALAIAALVLDDAVGGAADDALIPGLAARLATVLKPAF